MEKEKMKLLFFLFVFKTSADQVIPIGIIDTGYNKNYAHSIGAEPLKLCPQGHWDFLTNTSTIGHLPGIALRGRGNHGTLVASIIAEELKNIDYCAVVIQLFSECITNNCKDDMEDKLAFAFKRLNDQHVFAINLSYDGNTPMLKERLAMKSIANKGTSLFLAAGNRRVNLDKNCFSYPACYFLQNTYVIGAKDCMVSNTGSMVEYYPGTIPKSLKVEDLCATSYAAPRALSSFVFSVSRLLRGGYRLKPMPQAKTP